MRKHIVMVSSAPGPDKVISDYLKIADESGWNLVVVGTDDAQSDGFKDLGWKYNFRFLSPKEQNDRWGRFVVINGCDQRVRLNYGMLHSLEEGTEAAALVDSTVEPDALWPGQIYAGFSGTFLMHRKEEPPVQVYQQPVEIQVNSVMSGLAAPGTSPFLLEWSEMFIPHDVILTASALKRYLIIPEYDYAGILLSSLLPQRHKRIHPLFYPIRKNRHPSIEQFMLAQWDKKPVGPNWSLDQLSDGTRRVIDNYFNYVDRVC